MLTNASRNKKAKYVKLYGKRSAMLNLWILIKSKEIYFE